MIQITELLRTNSVGADRAVINSNFIILQDFVNDLETNLGINGAQNSIDLTGGSGSGIFKGKEIIVGNTTNGSLEITNSSNISKIIMDIQSGNGVISTDILTANISITVPTLNISTALNNTGESTFSQASTFNGLVEIKGGISKRLIDAGTVSGLSSNYVVFLNDSLIKINFDAPSQTLVLSQPSPELPDGHEITITNYGSNAGDLSTAQIAGGFSSIQFSANPYQSSITLFWDSTLGLWIIKNSVNMTLA